MKILISGKERAATNALAPIARELEQRKHEITIYATGNDNEVAGFEDLSYECLKPESINYNNLIKDFDLVIVGASGINSSDANFIKAANIKGLPSIAVQYLNSNYKTCFGDKITNLPTVLGIVNEDCKDKIKANLSEEMAKEGIKRSRVIGWSAYDNYAEIKNNFDENKRAEVLYALSLNPDENIYVHFTQNIYPESDYMILIPWSDKEKQDFFDYEMKVTEAAFQAAADLSLKLVAKPHPGEKYRINFTEDLTKKFGFDYISEEANDKIQKDNKKVILSANSLSSGISQCLNEACLFDKNIGGLLPEIEESKMSAFPPLLLDAVPYTLEWQGIPEIIKLITSSDKTINKELAENRKRFAVDGNASKRLADLIEQEFV